MNYEFFMKVGYVINDEKLGHVIVGTNPNISSNNLTGINWVDKCIMIKTINGDFSFKVKKVDISFSIANNINIGVIFYKSDNFDKIKPGDLVYKILAL